MLNGVKIRNIYSKIQTQLFYMIPEKWDKIYLYAAVVEKMNNIQTGEMFFYYYPKGLLKKNPVNVYEVPSKFNIDEKAYMKLVDKLYETIKLLRKEFEKTEEKVWSNLTISIENLKFNIEYNYEDLQKSHYSNYDRHIVWKYKYLDISIDRLTKRDRKMLEEYLINEQFENIETKTHTENMYQKNVHNIVEYDREYNEQYNTEYDGNDDYEIYEENTYERREKNKKLDKYELYKRKQEEQKKKEKQLEIENQIQDQQVKKRNQILNF